MNNLFLPAFVFLFVFAFTVLIEKPLASVLRYRASQPIYKDGPSWHMSKQGTPTMGGLAFVLSSVMALIPLSFFLVNKNGNDVFISIIISVIFCLFNALIGIVDDLTKLKRKENAGLTPIQKLVFQTILAVIFLMARKRYLGDSTTIDFSLFKIDFRFFYYPLAIIILLGIINCANLTDGVDGLSSSVALTIGAVFLFIGIDNLETTLLSSILMGAAIGFLLFNSHPAKIFMGDTGSLFFGALSACLAFSIRNPITIILIGGVYVIEGISVILQVAVYKATKKRLFKMAPLHHHLEKEGIE